VTDYQIYVAGGIFIKDRKVLGVRTRKRPAFIVPGGKIEAGEQPSDTLIREVKEEIGLEIKNTDFKLYGTIYEDASLGDFNKNRKMRMDAFLIMSWKGMPAAKGEVDEIRWLDSKALTNTELGSILKNHLLPDLRQQGLID
jgi:8-oxo-dGTP diphosphatase